MRAECYLGELSALCVPCWTLSVGLWWIERTRMTMFNDDGFERLVRLTPATSAAVSSETPGEWVDQLLPSVSFKLWHDSFLSSPCRSRHDTTWLSYEMYERVEWHLVLVQSDVPISSGGFTGGRATTAQE